MSAPIIGDTAARPSTFWFGLFGIAVVSFFEMNQASTTDVAGFLLILGTGLLPAFLWCHRRAAGLPLYPIFAAGTIGTFALPLISHHPLVIEYSPRERFLAALTIAATNLTGTISWYLFTRDKVNLPRRHYALRRVVGRMCFFGVLAATIAFNLLELHLLDTVNMALLSIGRAVVIAFSNLAFFVLAYQWGRRELPRLQVMVCAGLFLAVMVSTLPSALMVNALSYGVLGLIGFALGRGRVPWLSLSALTAMALFLQGGKEQLRDKYWYSAEAAPIAMTQYPEMIEDWLRFSFGARFEEPAVEITGDPSRESFTQRASLLQLFLRIQQMSPADTPYLHGRTYTIIPGLLIPRVFNAQKARTHLGTYILAMHYELQTVEDTYTTTIGFGLINEAMANFGYAGCLALGAVLGAFYGAVSRWSAGYPLLSVRMLLAILVLTVSFQNEFSAGVYVTTLFQGGCALLGLVLLTTKRITLPTTGEPRLQPAAA